MNGCESLVKRTSLWTNVKSAYCVDLREENLPDHAKAVSKYRDKLGGHMGHRRMRISKEDL